MQNIFINNLAITTTEQELRKFMEQYGEVLTVQLVVDRDTSVPRGFAFVEMKDEASAEQAVKDMHGKTMDGRVLSLNLARPKLVEADDMEKSKRKHRKHRY